MKKAASLNWLIPIIVLLAVTAALFGLLTQGGPGAHSFATLRGQAAQIYGKGLYQFDTVFRAATFRAADLITLCVSVPLLLIAFARYQRGRLRGALLLISAIPFFLYNGASMTFGAMFNRMFLVYVAIFSASLFAFVIALTIVDTHALSEHMSPRVPRRGIAIFLFVAGIGNFFLWLSELIGPLLSGGAPANLGPYTTMFTHGLDSAVITPATVITGIWLLP